MRPFWVPETGDEIVVELPPEEPSHYEPEDIHIEPVFEDEDLLIINKQPGYTVHPTKGHPNHTIANGVMDLAGLAAEEEPESDDPLDNGFVLDRPDE